ncbi:ead/Ea22-like family protein [Escherichia coli]|uniref:ead/Ea22-like family protein n=2 Tax=Escherichia TaxID=561 RepID=UPI002FCD7F7D
MSEINHQALREAVENATWGDWDSYKPHRGARGYEVRLSSQAIAQHVLKNNAEFIAAFNPKVALALLDERERNQQYIKRRDQENEDIALTVGRLLIENGQLVADTLRHLADNEIDSDYFAITSTNENGTEIDHEMAITDYALQAAGTVDELVAALESAEKRIAELEAEPVSQTYKSQHTQFEQVADLYEMQFDDGRTCAFHTDAQKAAQWLQACDGNRVQEYVKLERLQNALSGNSPVTPDGWISCSERMPNEEDVLVYCSDTKEMMVGFHKGKGLFQFFYMNGVEGVCEPSHWMPLPEPPL